MTFLVQSSSVFTSAITPLIGNKHSHIHYLCQHKFAIEGIVQKRDSLLFDNGVCCIFQYTHYLPHTSHTGVNFALTA